MIEQENQDVTQDFVNPSTQEFQSDQQDTQSENNEYQASRGQATQDKDYNFRILREKLDLQSQRLDQTEKENAELREALLKMAKPQIEQEIDEYADLSDDDWVNRKYVDSKATKAAEKTAKQIVEEALQKERERQQQEQLPNLLKQKHPDFDDVVTKENVDYLKAHEPEIIKSLAANQDPYAQGIAAYKFIKAYCPKAKLGQQSSQQVDDRPGTMSNSYGGSSVAGAKMFEKGLTPELKQKLHQEMVQAARNF